MSGDQEVLVAPDASDSPRRTISRKLIVVARQLVRRFDQIVERNGVSRAKFGVVAIVSRHPGVTQRVIADRLHISEAGAGRLIERLCESNLLERREDPCDRRAHRIHLTDAARPMLDRLGALATIQEEEAFVGFDDADLQKLDELLERITRNLAVAASTK